MVFDTLGFPVIDAQGRVTFHAGLKSASGASIANYSGIWSEGSGTLTKVARAGEQAFGAPAGVNYQTFQPPAVSATGHLAFGANLSGFGVVDRVNDEGIWTGFSDSLSMVMRLGDQAPGAPPGAKFNKLDYQYPNGFLPNNSGELVFGSALVGSGVDSSNDSGMWLYRGGSLDLVTREGDPAPGQPSGVFLSQTSNVFLNAAGSVAFLGSLSGTGIDSSNNIAIWKRTSDSLDLVVQSGDSDSSTEDDVIFSNLAGLGLSRTGETAFRGTLQGTGITSKNNVGIWLEEFESLTLIAREGDRAPGMPEGEVFGSLQFQHIESNSVGQVAFGSFTTSSNGIWAGGPGALILVVRVGEHAPGTPEGVGFRNFIGRSPALNNAGHIAFAATLMDSGGVNPRGSGIWAQDRNGLVRLIAFEGDEFEIAPGDTRTVRSLSFVGEAIADLASAGRSTLAIDRRSTSSAFNDASQFAFKATFDDGSQGIFVSSFAAIPEPNSLWLGASIAAGLLVRRSRPRH
ncbi:MAG: hypothetical protein KDA57_08150 [Planctomycetales bacterium]|nr:hypothetical protein [Planctomycetales bacterium]